MYLVRLPLALDALLDKVAYLFRKISDAICGALTQRFNERLGEERSGSRDSYRFWTEKALRATD